MFPSSVCLKIPSRGLGPRRLDAAVLRRCSSHTRATSKVVHAVQEASYAAVDDDSHLLGHLQRATLNESKMRDRPSLKLLAFGDFSSRANML